MEVNGKTEVCGLIGFPVEHTLSPLIHNTLAERMGHNMVYVPFPVAADQVGEAVRGAYALHIRGLNVTVPHKSAVIPYLSRIDSLAEAIGAVNTLVRGEDGYEGYNTDMEGLYRALLSENIMVRDEEILLLGGGGAARAVAFLCAAKGAKRVYILNRTLNKAEEIASEVNRVLKTDCMIPMALSDYQQLPDRKYLAIQSTSVGLHPHAEQAVITDSKFYEKIHTGYDLIYKPAETRFMRLTRNQGGKACNGLKMLLYQGIIAYERWNHVTVSEEDVEVLYQKMKACETNEN